MYKITLRLSTIKNKKYSFFKRILFDYLKILYRNNCINYFMLINIDGIINYNFLSVLKFGGNILDY